MNPRNPYMPDLWSPTISPEDAERIERENREMIEDAFTSDLEPLNFDPPWVRSPAVFPESIAPEPAPPADPIDSAQHSAPTPASSPEPISSANGDAGSASPAPASPARGTASPKSPAPARKRRTRAEASRENGRKSRGPKTREGKAVSSQNAIKHGLSARHVVIGIEEEQEWYEFREEARQLLKPVGLIQLGYADEWAAARWRLRRCAGIETLLFDRVLAEQDKEPKVYDVMDNVARIGLAFRAAKEDLNALGRYESRIRRSGERALRTLRELQAEARQHSDSASPAWPARYPDPSNSGEVPDAPEPEVPAQTAEVQNEPTDTQPAPADAAPPSAPAPSTGSEPACSTRPVPAQTAPDTPEANLDPQPAGADRRTPPAAREYDAGYAANE